MWILRESLVSVSANLPKPCDMFSRFLVRDRIAVDGKNTLKKYFINFITKFTTNCYCTCVADFKCWLLHIQVSLFDLFSYWRISRLLWLWRRCWAATRVRARSADVTCCSAWRPWRRWWTRVWSNCGTRSSQSSWTTSPVRSSTRNFRTCCWYEHCTTCSTDLKFWSTTYVSVIHSVDYRSRRERWRWLVTEKLGRFTTKGTTKMLVQIRAHEFVQWCWLCVVDVQFPMYMCSSTCTCVAVHTYMDNVQVCTVAAFVLVAAVQELGPGGRRRLVRRGGHQHERPPQPLREVLTRQGEQSVRVHVSSRLPSCDVGFYNAACHISKHMNLCLKSMT